MFEDALLDLEVSKDFCDADMYVILKMTSWENANRLVSFESTVAIPITVQAIL